jgi:hypothetical protein
MQLAMIQDEILPLKEMDRAYGDRGLYFGARIGLGKALQDIDEIDFQGRTLFTVLKKPAAYAALVYFLRLYLSANA